MLITNGFSRPSVLSRFPPGILNAALEVLKTIKESFVFLALKPVISRIAPFIGIFSTDVIISIFFQGQKVQYLGIPLMLYISGVYFVCTYITNYFSRLVAYGWIGFLFLGIININSTLRNTRVWSLDIQKGTYLYLSCILVFAISIIVFEHMKPREMSPPHYTFVPVRLDFLAAALLTFPLFLLYTLYKSVGFIPIMMGVSFIDDMYHLDYGGLYGFKFICCYSFLYALLIAAPSRLKIPIYLYSILLIFILSADGKRFVTLVCLISSLPVFYFIKSHIGRRTKALPVFTIATLVLAFYVLVLVLRTGTDKNEVAKVITDKIPFGIEYKDYIHSINTVSDRHIAKYNFEQSAIGAFLNSGMLKGLGMDKDDLVKKGSAYVWSDLYNEGFGIRTGIISELYFAYGYFAILLMIGVAYMTNLVTKVLVSPRSYFHLVQYSILYGLIFLMINGQATVFFGCLTMMVYVYLAYLISRLLNGARF